MSAATRGQAAYEAYSGHANVAWIRPYGERYDRWADLPAAEVTAWTAFAAVCLEGDTDTADQQAAYEALAASLGWKGHYANFDRWADLSTTVKTAYLAAATAAIAADVSDDPTYTSVSPTHGTVAGGTAITITGTKFTGATGATIGGVACTSFVVVSDTSITCVTPAMAKGARDLIVTTPNGTVTGTGAYTGDLSITSITPNTGTTAGGDAVTLAGVGFTGATALTIGGTACTSVVVVSDISITAVTPAKAAAAYNVVVTTPHGTGTLTNGFTYS